MPELHPDDLVDDRALRSADEDAFRHVDFVTELAEIVRATNTPANVALYAPWGSGKTGMAHLLEAEFEPDPKVRFVRFDAFKYAEAPLRRHFLAQVASDLELPKKVHKDPLYGDETHTTLKLPPREGRKLIGWFVLALVAVVGVALLGCVIYGALARGEFTHEFRDATTWLMPKVFAPAAVFAAIVTIAGKRFTYDRTVRAPSSEEEFEERFEALVTEAVGIAREGEDGEKEVDDTKCRLVVFIDELDRCSPKEVVATLETLWTFFDVTGCVFIVAADQQVLEEALSRKARQATPRDSTSPYYSAGSAYLDKIFHYQQALPPLKPQRLTSFALGLVEGRSGLWKRVAKQTDLGDVISILVPSHVRSPRRVKALLNTFAMLYRVAEQRALDDVLGEIGPRVSGLAKLACLRVEFPLFAADLAQEPRMPEYVLLASEEAGEEDLLPEHVDEHVKARARRWERGLLEVDRIISREEGDDEQDEEEGDEGIEDNEAVRVEYANQLVAYLSKTRSIPGPGRDLIYLESAGFEVGLDPTVADELEIAAVDGRRPQVRRMVDRLEGEDQLNAYRLLAHLARHSTIGLEGQNTVGALMEALAIHKLPLAPIADEVCAAIAHQSYELADADLGGALALSLESEHRGAQELRAKVVTDERTPNDAGLALVMIRSVGRIDSSYAEFVAHALYVVAISDPELGAEAVNKAPLEPMIGAADELDGHLGRSLEEAEESTEQIENLIRFFEGVAAPSPERNVIAQAVAKSFLRSRHEALVNAVDTRMRALTPITHQGFARVLLEGAQEEESVRAIRWLEAVDPTQIPNLRNVTDLVDPILLKIWTDAADGTLTSDDLRVALSATRRLADAGALGQCPATQDTALAILQEPATTEPDAERRPELFDFAAELTSAGCLSEAAVADSALIMARSSFGSAAAASDAQVDSVLDLVERFSEAASQQAFDELRTGGVSAPWQGAAQSAWIIAAAERDSGTPLTPEDVAELGRNSSFDRGFAVWLMKFASEVDETLTAIAPIKSQPPTERVRVALTAHCEWWLENEAGAHEEFVTRLIAAAPEEALDDEFAAAALITRVPSEKLIDALVNACAAAADPSERGNVIALLSATEIGDQTEVDRVLLDLFVPVAQQHTEPDLRALMEDLSWLKRGSQSARDTTRRALRVAADALSIRDELEGEMREAGLSRKKGFLGLGGQQDI